MSRAKPRLKVIRHLGTHFLCALKYGGFQEIFYIELFTVRRFWIINFVIQKLEIWTNYWKIKNLAIFDPRLSNIIFTYILGLVFLVRVYVILGNLCLSFLRIFSSSCGRIFSVLSRPTKICLAANYLTVYAFLLFVKGYIDLFLPKKNTFCLLI